MRVLVVGGGGREHALCWAIAASPLLDKLWCAPGNPGTATVAENVPIGVLDIAALVEFAEEHRVDLVVPGPEAPLAAGVADAMGLAGIACCGPSAAAAREFVRRRGAPIVVKADGLAAGKGVVVAGSVAEAEQAIVDFMDRRSLGDAGAAVVIEEVLAGEEVSLFALCDGTHAIAFGAAQDHKRLGEGDTGPNTGGMGAYAPPPALTAALEHAAMEQVVRPALAELTRRGTPFRGFLFAGLMLTADGPKLIEFNARLGDPETQCLLPLLQSDILPALLAACDGGLDAFSLRWRAGASMAVVMAARGYPGATAPGTPIRGIEAADGLPLTEIFQAATDRRGGELVAAGGRVLTVSARGDTLRAARDAAYAGVDAIDWPDGFCRRDIGWRALGGSGKAAAG